MLLPCYTIVQGKRDLAFLGLMPWFGLNYRIKFKKEELEQQVYWSSTKPLEWYSIQ